jgi:septum formation protein
MKRIILASQSPRRKELLTNMGVAFTAIPSDYEEHLDDARNVAEVAKELGLGKALDVARKYPDAIVIGSDTIVSMDGKQLGKPRDRAHALEMLEWLKGRRCAITTSLAVVCLAENTQIIEIEVSYIYMKDYTRAQLDAYLDTGDHADKAGAFSVQSGFAPLVDHIEGDYDAIIGLPTRKLAAILQKLGVAGAHSAEITSPLIVK